MRNSRKLLTSAAVLSGVTAAAHLAWAQTPSASPPAPQPATAPPTQNLSQYLGVSAYPSKGQTSKQQTLDEKACFDWAKSQTGIDPVKLAQNPPPQPTQPATDESHADAGNGERARGAVRGAAAGAAIGAIAGDTGPGAAIGATAGTFQGGRRKREAEAQQQNQAQAQQEKQQTAAEDQLKAQKQSYTNAFSACLTGKGYAVK
jgi:hypothetical protein